MQNFKALGEYCLLPKELKLQKQVFNFDRTMKKVCKYNADYFALDKSEKHYAFFCRYFDADMLEPVNNHVCLSKKKWKQVYDNTMTKAKEYIQENEKELLDKLNNAMFQEEWEKYAAGDISTWEMDALGYYHHDHELKDVDYHKYNIKKFADLPYVPEADCVFKKGDKEIKIPKTCRIIGTVVGKNNTKAQVDILTRDSGVVTVKFNLEYFAKYNRRISAIIKGESKVVEQGWFQKGTLICVNGYRSADMFRAKSYKKTNSHQLYKIISVAENGTIEMINTRYGEE